MSFHYSTSTPSSSNGGSSATSTNQPSTSTVSRMAFTPVSQRTSAKRSFEEYGLNNDARSSSSSQPSGSSAAPIGQGPLGTSSMADAMGILGLGLDADTAITNILGDNAANNTHNAQNTRFKRRRNSLNGAANGNEIPLPTPHLPVGPFIHTSDPSSTDRAMPGTGDVHMTWTREPGANQSTSAISANPPLSSLEPPSTQSDAQAVRSSISSILARSLQSSDLWNEVQSDFAPQDDTRSNRMSWTSTAPPTFDTVTTNTEPGWNFASSTRNLALEFSMPSNDATAHSSSSRPFENNYVNNESRSTLPAAANSSSRSNIHITPASFESTSSSLAQIPSPQTDFSFSSSLFARRNYSPVMISDSDESMGVRTRWPSPGPSQPSIQPTESSSSNNLPWWPHTWGYMEENRVPPPPTHSPPAPPHAAAVQQSNFSMPSHPNALDTSVGGNRSRPDELYRTRRPSSSAWDFVDASPVTPSEYRGYPYYLPSPTDVSSGGNSSRDLPGAPYSGRRTDESPNSFHNGSTQYHPQSASASDSDSTMDLHRLLNRHTGLNSLDHFPDMTIPMPRSNEHTFVPSYIQSHVQQQHQQPSPTQESSNGARRVRFPDDVHHAPPSNRVVSPPPPNRRSSAFPFHALFDRHTRRNEPETPGYSAPSVSASSHARSASDGAQGNTQAPSSQNNPSYSRYSDRPDSWRDSFYPNSVPRRPIEPVLFSRIGDSDSREPTPRPPVGVRLREPIIDTSANPNPLLNNSYFPDDLLPLPSPDRERDRERRELNSFLNRQPSTTRAARVPPVSATSTNNGFWPRAPFGLAPPGLRSNEGAAPPPPASTSTSRHGRQLSLGGLSGLGPSLSLANRPPTPTPSSPSSASPPSPLHHLPFIGGFRPSNAISGNVDLPPSSASRRNNRRSQPRLETSFPWLTDSPISPHPFLFDDDEVLPGAISVPRGRAGRGSRAARQPYRMLSVGRIRAVGDYVLDDDFDDSYEGLLALEQLIGPARKGCSTEVLNKLPSGTLKELIGTEKSLSEEEKCPVCLDEYEKDQVCTKLPRCSHIYHKDCILGWLKTASTCPVCRESVEEASRSDPAPTPAARRSSALARAHRFSQGLGIGQYLRDASGPSTSGTAAGNSQNSRRNARRRNTNEGQNSVPPMRDLAVDGSGPSTGSRRERNRRLQLDLLSIDTSLGSSSSRPIPFHQRHESEDSGLAQGTSRTTASSPTRPAAEGSSTSRFTRGPLARLLAPEIASFSRYA